MSTIPLQVQPAQIASPIQSLGQLMQLRDIGTQVQLRQAQASEYAAQAQQRQKDIQDQDTVQKAMADPDANAKIHTGDFSGLAGKVQPKTLQALQQQQVEYQKGLLANDAETQKQRTEATGEVQKALIGLTTLTGPDGKPDLTAMNQALPGTIAQLTQNGVFKRAGISNIPQNFTSLDQVKQFQATIGGALAANQQALALKEAEGKATEAQAKGEVQSAVAANLDENGLTPEQQVTAQGAAATRAEAHAVHEQTAAHERATESISRFEANTQAQRAAAETSLAQSAMGDREIAAFTKPHQANLTSGQQQMEKVNEATTLLDSKNAETQALAIPKVITALVGGQGSGVRITQSEQDALLHARGLEGNLEAWGQRIKNGQKLTPAQVSQLKGALSDMGARLNQKIQISNSTIDQIQNAPDRHSRIVADQMGRQHLNALETGQRYVGEQVSLKNGQKVTVSAVHPDGSFDAN